MFLVLDNDDRVVARVKTREAAHRASRRQGAAGRVNRVGSAERGLAYQVGSTILVRKFAGEPREVLRKYRVEEKGPGYWHGTGVGKGIRGMRDGGRDDEIVRVVQLKPSITIRPYTYHREPGFLVGGPGFGGVFTKTRAGAEKIRDAIRTGDEGIEEETTRSVLLSGG